MHVANDGSFYLTIEESNELRKKLGMKPLNVTTNQTATSLERGIEPKNEEDETSEVHKRIELAKIKRKERELKRIKGEDDEEDIKPTVVKKEKRVILETNEDEEMIQNSSKTKVYDLHASKPTIASDFEAVKKKKAKNIRVKEKLSDASITTSGADLLSMMELNAAVLGEESKATSRTERKISRREENLLLEEREKDRNYQEAIDKAHEQSKVLHQSFSSNFETNREEDSILNYNHGKKYDATKHFVKTISIEKADNEEEAVINKRKRKSQSLRTKDADGDQVMEEASQTTTIVQTTEVKKEEEEPPTNLQEELIKEPLVSDGLLATLEFAKRQGFLEDKRVGRNKDKSHIEEREKSKLLEVNEDIDFVIEHLDQYGRATTPKQAYINFSHSYHGNKPKKKKVAKEKKKMELERRRNAGASDDSMKVLETVMKETKQPFVEITKETFEKAVEIRTKLQKEFKPKKKKQKKEEVKE
ncbi:hypothetical protein C9374_006142 [Naegleria lovaniensis]|uniref:SART-1 family protein n=1 Tax=Naegleria lovaniensis TaxID=51637 RepID=A0AA88GNH2_NAELO|nr:uncharacterized protein C9374_006142 [Naegleria lovaniensis]KAG2381758.1 hypothetical protein C9374_006142 [Naegleria lovaniensis]